MMIELKKVLCCCRRCPSVADC